MLFDLTFTVDVLSLSTVVPTGEYTTSGTSSAMESKDSNATITRAARNSCESLGAYNQRYEKRIDNKN